MVSVRTWTDTPPEFKAKALAMSAAAEKDPTTHLEQLEIDVSGGKIERSIIVNGQRIWGLMYKIGVEQESSGPDGRPAKVNNYKAYTLLQQRRCVEVQRL